MEEISKGVCSCCGQIEDAFNRPHLGWAMLGHSVKTRDGKDTKVLCVGSWLAPQTMNIKVS